MPSPATPTEILILAGGFGTRLQSVVSEVPKPMAPVNETPFLAHLIRFWASKGITRAVLSIGYLGNVIKDYFGDSFANVAIEYIQETSPLGTGGAIRYALQQSKWNTNDVWIINGDTWFDADLNQIHSLSQNADATITLGIKQLDVNSRYGGVLVDTQGKISEFGVPPADSSLINTGVYLANHPKLITELASEAATFSFEQRSLVQLAAAGKCYGSVQTGGFLDIGIPEDYARAPKFIENYL